MPDYAPILDAADLRGRDGFRIELDSGNPQRGLEVSAAGDVNGDGFDDFMVSQEYGGHAFVVFGHTGHWKAELSLLSLNGANGFELTDSQTHYSFGSAVSAGDINGDGFDDVIVGAPSTIHGQINSGSEFVIFGHAGGWDASLDVSTLDGQNGFRLDGAAPNAKVGSTVAAADLNGDGIADLVTGGFDGEGAPAIGYVVFGKTGTWASDLNVNDLDGSNGFALVADGTDSVWIHKVSAAGDVNGDGFADMLLTAEDITNNTNRVCLVFGSSAGPGASLDLSTLDGTNGVTINPHADSFFGRSLSSAGDINGDGFDDIVIGDSDALPDKQGQAYVVFGHGGAWDPTIGVSRLDGTNGFSLTGTQDFEHVGISVSGAGDFNGDGYQDIIVGAAGDNSWLGAAYVIFGHAGGWDANYDLRDLDGNSGFKIVGDARHAYTGATVSSAGDTNGDGFDDLLVTTFSGRHHRVSQIYVIFGHGPDDAVTRAGSGIGQVIHGGDFGDILSGVGGDDTLQGGKAADTLAGGAGADVLVGGSGQDHFVFTSTQDSTGGAFDVIEDLHSNEVIDLSAIDADTTQAGDQAFHVVRHFDGQAGELDLDYDAGAGMTSVMADVDGDGVADMTILITENHIRFTGFEL